MNASTSSPGQAPRRNTLVVGIGNQKGGVGKTTMTVQLACALAERGRTVLIIDLDVNAGSTKHLGIDPRAFLGTFEVLVGDEDPLDVVITNEDEGNSLPPNLHILTGSRKLEELEDRLRRKKSKFDDTPLHDVLKPVVVRVRGYYDYIFLDTPPSAPLPIIAAYKSADAFLLVAIPEGLAIEGLNEALHDVEEVKKYGNPNLHLLGLAIGAVDMRTRLSRELLGYVNGKFKEYVLKPVIPRSTVLPTAQTLQKSIFQTDPQHPITEAFRELSREFEAKAEKLLGIVRSVPSPPIEEEAIVNG